MNCYSIKFIRTKTNASFLSVSTMRKYKERNVFFSGRCGDLLEKCVICEETAFHGFINVSGFRHNL